MIEMLIFQRDNYTFNLSLTMTSVSSNTILSSTSALWTLILGTVVGVEKFNLLRFIGVILTLGGVVIVSLSDTRNDGEDTLWGDLLALLSAMTYAVYVILYKKLVKNEERVDNFLFLGNITYFSTDSYVKD
jgi:solute carrier family 35 protein F5